LGIGVYNLYCVYSQKPNTPACNVASLKEKGHALLNGDKVSVENIKATEVTGVLTALLIAEGDNVCVEEVFDSKGQI
jgi:hypothetical protein